MTPIRFRSTRSEQPRISFREALLQGLAPDGGLYVPDTIPALEASTWNGAADFSSLAQNVLEHWIGTDVEPNALSAIVRDALDFDVPLVPLEGGEWDGIHVLELFHGPTLSFKDFGARMMARLMSHFLRNEQQHLTILVATSGDTGSAVADGFAGQSNIRVVLLYPDGQVSPTQEQQLILRRPGVTAVAVDGSFDDCQRMVKEAFADPALRTRGLSSANSINIGRLLPQMLYYLEAVRSTGLASPVFCVPSGNLGNLTGGILAHLSGLPVGQFIAAHNANDFFPRHLTEGLTVYRPSRRTFSNAMDVGVPSNFERLRFLLHPEELRRLIHGVSISDEDTLVSMRRVYDVTGYVADPHTAVGLEAVRRYRNIWGDEAPAVVLSTAHPAKFPDIVRRAIGITPDVPPQLAQLQEAETHVVHAQPEVKALKEILATASDERFS